MGESNDAPAEVQIEIRAAEIAIDMLDEDEDLDGDISSHANFGEAVGWWFCYFEGSSWEAENPVAAAESWGGLAGYLARAIVTHDEPLITEPRRKLK
jgi:hypothetical protein